LIIGSAITSAMQAAYIASQGAFPEKIGQFVQFGLNIDKFIEYPLCQLLSERQFVFFQDQ
jgi:hypothetical protein